MNSFVKQILISTIIFVLVIFLVDNFYPEWAKTISYLIFIGVVIFLVIKGIKYWKQNSDDPADIYNYVFPGKTNFIGRLAFIILILGVMLLSESNLKNDFIDLSFLNEKTEREIIINTYDFEGNLVKQTNHHFKAPPFYNILGIGLWSAFLLISIIRQKKVDDERVNMIKLKAYRETLIVSIGAGIILSFFSFFFYSDDKLWLIYLFLVLLVYTIRSNVWSEKM